MVPKAVKDKWERLLFDGVQSGDKSNTRSARGGWPAFLPARPLPHSLLPYPRGALATRSTGSKRDQAQRNTPRAETEHTRNDSTAGVTVLGQLTSSHQRASTYTHATRAFASTTRSCSTPSFGPYPRALPPRGASDVLHFRFGPFLRARTHIVRRRVVTDARVPRGHSDLSLSLARIDTTPERRVFAYRYDSRLQSSKCYKRIGTSRHVTRQNR